ncbi:thioredoxin family protein [Brevibacillus daliensis]|uniref:thioredoxin family protein n=1 Tax=Brevibacillus daliensis TaxID=2892995 RepID=UPI001E43CA3E|nr:thioredoxin family protein [Brevibacillus daliensis]
MKDIDLTQLNQIVNENTDKMFLYIYTPLCGTCNIAYKMLTVMEQLFPAVMFYRANINMFPDLAREWEITSVPALLYFEDGIEKSRCYAFFSTPDLYEWMKNLIT